MKTLPSYICSQFLQVNSYTVQFKLNNVHDLRMVFSSENLQYLEIGWGHQENDFHNNSLRTACKRTCHTEGDIHTRMCQSKACIVVCDV